jgi:hypothetical protein
MKPYRQNKINFIPIILDLTKKKTMEGEVAR